MSANDKILRRQLSHHTYLQRYSTSVANKMLSLLNQSELDVIVKLNTRLERILTAGKDRGPRTSERLVALLDSIRALRADAFASVDSAMSDEMSDFMRFERNFQMEILTSSVPVTLEFVAPPIERLKQATLSRPFQGRLMKEWLRDIPAKEMAEVRRLIKLGIVEGETTPEIIARVAPKLKTSRSYVETIVRSAISHIAANTREEIGQANSDIIKAVKWVSTLDTRTSEHCRPRDNKTYTLDHKPIGHAIPWSGGPGRIHPRCRSVSTYVTKSWKELGIDLKEAPEGTRASMNGQVPDDMSYYDWLQSVGKTKDKTGRTLAEAALGKERGRLFNQGKLTGAQFNDKDGTAFTLKELEAIEPRAFE